MVAWLPPSLGTMKINFDTVIVCNKVSTAFVIRDHNGKIIRARDRLLSISSVPAAKLIAAWLGLVLRWPYLRCKQLAYG